MVMGSIIVLTSLYCKGVNFLKKVARGEKKSGCYLKKSNILKTQSNSNSMDRFVLFGLVGFRQRQFLFFSIDHSFLFKKFEHSKMLVVLRDRIFCHP
jgi:hypothetical protein